jgi:hypothetical protein
MQQTPATAMHYYSHLGYCWWIIGIVVFPKLTKLKSQHYFLEPTRGGTLFGARSAQELKSKLSGSWKYALYQSLGPSALQVDCCFANRGLTHTNSPGEDGGQ